MYANFQAGIHGHSQQKLRSLRAGFAAIYKPENRRAEIDEVPVVVAKHCQVYDPESLRPRTRATIASEMLPELREALINQLALRSFRDIAEGDYIAARMAFRAELYLQALWSSQQALEKYLKAILLLRSIPWKEHGTP